MKYYLREMHGSFVRFRLVALKDDEKPPLEDEQNKEDTILAHMWQVPDSPLSELFECNDFSGHFVLGPEHTGDGHQMAGHHLGKHTEITKKRAKEILKRARKAKRTVEKLFIGYDKTAQNQKLSKS